MKQMKQKTTKHQITASQAEARRVADHAEHSLVDRIADRVVAAALSGR